MNYGDVIDPRETSFLGIQIPEALAASRDVSSTAKLVYGHLRRRAEKNGFAWPSYKDIAKHIGVGSWRAAQRAVVELQSTHPPLIQVTARHDSGRQTSNMFSFIWGPLLEPLPKEGVKNDPPVSNDTHPPVSNDTGEGVKNDTQIDNSTNETTTKRQGPIDKNTQKKKAGVNVSVKSATDSTTEQRWEPSAEDYVYVVDALNKSGPGLQPPANKLTAVQVLKYMDSVPDFDWWLEVGSPILAKATGWGLFVKHAQRWPEQREDAPKLGASKPPKPPEAPKPESPHFDAFWEHYWRKTNKAKAILAFDKHAPTDEAARIIIDAVIAHAPYYLNRDREHQPQATTWLNGFCYTEAPEW